MIYCFDRLIQKYNERRGTFIFLGDVFHPCFKSDKILRFAVPKSFVFRAGKYAEVRMLTLSKFQWHDFAIVSACCEPEMVSFNKTLDDWTRKLHNVLRSASLMRKLSEVYIANSCNFSNCFASRMPSNDKFLSCCLWSSFSHFTKENSASTVFVPGKIVAKPPA